MLCLPFKSPSPPPFIGQRRLLVLLVSTQLSKYPFSHVTRTECSWIRVDFRSVLILCSDFAHYDPGLTDVPIVPTAEFNNLQLLNYTLVGPGFYKLTKNFASLNATFVIQVPLAPNNISEPVAWAEVAVKEVGWENIEAIEIGVSDASLFSSRARSRRARMCQSCFSGIFKGTESYFRPSPELSLVLQHEADPSLSQLMRTLERAELL